MNYRWLYVHPASQPYYGMEANYSHSTNAGINIVTDFAIIILPIPESWPPTEDCVDLHLRCRRLVSTTSFVYTLPCAAGVYLQAAVSSLLAVIPRVYDLKRRSRVVYYMCYLTRPRSSPSSLWQTLGSN
jgi:hypothetical protein